MAAVGTRTAFFLGLLVLVPVLLIALALFGVLLLWRHLRRKDAQRAVEPIAQAERTEPAVPGTEETTTPVSRSLGEALRENRLHCGLTQEDVAEALNVSRQAVSKWENGTSDPTTGNLLALARLYGVSAEELLRAASGEG